MEPLFIWLNEIALWISVYVYAQNMEKREYFRSRVVFATALYLVLTGILNGLLTNAMITADIFTRVCWYLLIAGFLYFGWEIRVSLAFYYAIWSFMSWQLLYELWLVLNMILEHANQEHFFVYVIGNLAVYVLGYSIIALTFAKWMTEGKQKIGPRQMSSGLLIFWIFELVGIEQRALEMSATDSKWELLYITQLLLAVVLYLQNEMFKKSALRQELTEMNLLRKMEQEQYQMSKENIELINQKCHDLKHQIHALRHMEKDEMNQYLDEIEESVRFYEAIVKTGNEVLDTILTEKSLYCNSRGIVVSCVADGSQMDFINTVDLYSILGNAMDNAIEAVEKFQEPEKRQIDVVIYRQQNFLVLNIINPLSGELNFVGGVPVTTKADKRYHGFGIKSMKYVVKKYDGFLNIEEENGCFSLKILIPIPRTT